MTLFKCIGGLKKAPIRSFLTCCLWEAHNLTHSHARTHTHTKAAVLSSTSRWKTFWHRTPTQELHLQQILLHPHSTRILLCLNMEIHPSRGSVFCIYCTEGCQIWGWPLIVAHGARMNGNVNCIPPTFHHLLLPFHISITNYYATTRQNSPDL